ncbi:MAG: M67 family metallopeptidase [Chloroflexi bacterium]|nr:M67 family metallopeptidase [Chloroflexota bacterium]
MELTVRLERKYIDQMISHARAEKPNEACGLVAGRKGRGVKLYRGTNVHENKTTRYSLDPQELFSVWKEIDLKGWDLLAIYHSHPKSPAYPSATDLELAFYPDSFYIIISLMNDDEPVVRGFRIVDGRIHEAEVCTL